MYCQNMSFLKEKSLKKQHDEKEQSLDNETMSKFDQINENEKFKGRGLIITLELE